MMRLFLSTDTVFTSNGERVLDPIKCIETKSLHEDWYIEVELSLTDVSYVLQDSIIVVPTIYGNQPFRVGNIEVGKSMKFKARHVGYDLENYVVNTTSTGLSCADALTWIFGHCEPTANFSAYSDITTLKTISMPNMSVFEAVELIRQEYGGYLDFDGFQVRITSTLGADRQNTIAYGKDLVAASKTEDWRSVCTKVKPIGRNDIGVTGIYVSADVAYDKPYTKIVRFDVDTESELISEATDYLNLNKIPKVNYKVEASVVGNVFLNDTIKVNARQFKIFTNVLAYTYNNLISKMLTVEFGNYRPTVKNVFSNTFTRIENEAVRKASIMVDETAGEIRAYADNKIVLSVGEVEVGGRNLLSNSGFEDGFAQWTKNAGTEYMGNGQGDTSLEGKNMLIIVAGGTASGGAYQSVSGLIIGKEYTLSAWIYCSGGTWKIGANVGTLTEDSASGWHRVSTTFTATSTSHILYILAVDSASQSAIYVDNIQLEEGNKATAWKQANTEMWSAKYIFDGSKARFYSDGQEWYDDNGVLQVYFDTTNHRYVFKGRIESSSGLIAGWAVYQTYIQKGELKLDSANERIYLNTSAYMYAAASGRIGVAGVLTTNALFPTANNTYDLGLSTNRWATIWCNDATLNGSDLRLKKDVSPIDKGIDLILSLNPVQYKWKARENGRFHYGLVAQEVKQVMDSLGIDSGIYADPTVKPDWDRNNPDEENANHYLALRYTELIAPLIQTVQYLDSEIKNLKEKLNVE